MNLPFSVYDFFGYLATGFLVCIGIDYAVGKHWLVRDDLPMALTAFWIVAAYVVGQIIATPSSFIMEKGFACKSLGRPERILFGESKARVRRFFFPGYFTPLDSNVQSRVMDAARKNGIPHPGQSLFHHARTLAKRDEKTWDKLEAFLNQYGFSRNMAFALLLTAAVLAGRAWWVSDWKNLGCGAAVALASGVGMLYRFLKFYRQYAFELFTAYPDLEGARAT